MHDHPLYKKLLISEQEVTAHIDQLARTLIEEFKDTNPLFICLMRGGVLFASQLMVAISKRDPHFHPQLDYMTVSSYGDKLTAATPRIVADLAPKTTVTARPVIVLDDMIDKGGTYLFTKKHLEAKGASAIYLAVLVQRELEKPRGFDADFHCFSIHAHEWLTGMGLDDPRLGAEANRWLRYIAIAND